MDQRQTDLSLEEILDLLKTGSNHYPKCLLINELGIICRNEEDVNGFGEEYLLSAINSPRNGTKTIAFCCLSLIPGVQEKRAEEINEFRAKPENQELLPSIDQAIATFKENHC
jgi:hypothetical protein